MHPSEVQPNPRMQPTNAGGTWAPRGATLRAAKHRNDAADWFVVDQLHTPA